MTIKYYYGYAGENVTVYTMTENQEYSGKSYKITEYFTKNEEKKTIIWHGETTTQYYKPAGWQVVEQDFIIKNMIPWRWA